AVDASVATAKVRLESQKSAVFGGSGVVQGHRKRLELDRRARKRPENRSSGCALRKSSVPSWEGRAHGQPPFLGFIARACRSDERYCAGGWPSHLICLGLSWISITGRGQTC